MLAVPVPLPFALPFEGLPFPLPLDFDPTAAPGSFVGLPLGRFCGRTFALALAFGIGRPDSLGAQAFFGRFTFRSDSSDLVNLLTEGGLT